MSFLPPDRPRQDWRYLDRPRPQRSEGFWLLVFAGCCGVATFIMWPSLKPQFTINNNINVPAAASPPVVQHEHQWHSITGFGPPSGWPGAGAGLTGDAGLNDIGRRRQGMRLDPDVQPGQIEDRRGERGSMNRDLGGEDGIRHGRHRFCTAPPGSPDRQCGPWLDNTEAP